MPSVSGPGSRRREGVMTTGLLRSTLIDLGGWAQYVASERLDPGYPLQQQCIPECCNLQLCRFLHLKLAGCVRMMGDGLFSCCDCHRVIESWISRCMHRASYCSVYISKPTRCTNSYNVSLFIIKRSACFGLFSPSSGATFWSCISQLV